MYPETTIGQEVVRPELVTYSSKYGSAEARRIRLRIAGVLAGTLAVDTPL
jgi:hypothetical protein